MKTNKTVDQLPDLILRHRSYKAGGVTRCEDSAPKLLTPDVLLGLVNELREDRDHWKLRAERAEYALTGLLDLPSDWYGECGTCGYAPCAWVVIELSASASRR